MELDMSDYFHRLERLLDCPKAVCQPFLDQTRRMAKDFIQGNPNATANEVAEFLGNPQELAQGFLETLDPDILERYRKKKNIFRWCCVAALVIVLAFVSIYTIYIKKTPVHMEITDTLIIQSESTEDIS